MATYESLVRRADILWNRYSKNYQTMLQEYEILLEEKRQLGLKLYKIKKYDLNEWPELPLLYFENEDDMLQYVNSLEIHALQREIIDIDIWEGSYLYSTLKTWISEARSQIRCKKSGRLSGFVSPESCKSGPGRRSSYNYED